ncbi:MAG: hypothetical protein WD673_06685, partial [Alphaproteobacteria bacterium]
MSNGRGARFAFLTALGLMRRGFFIPYRYADRVPAPGARAPYDAMEALLGAHEAVFLALLDRVEEQAAARAAIPRATRGPGAPPP